MPTTLHGPQPQGSNFEEKDKHRLLLTLQKFCGVPAGNAGDDPVEAHPIWIALQHNDIHGWKTDFLGTAPSDFAKLTYLASADGTNNNATPVTLSIAHSRILHATLAYYHWVGLRAKKEVDILLSVPKANFDAWRTSIYSPDAIIVPYMKALEAETNSALVEWGKIARPQISDIPTYKDQAYWPKTKEKTETALTCMGLHKLIDGGFKPTITEIALDKRQMGWLFKAFQEKFLEPVAKAIILGYISNQDTRALWKKLCHKLDKSQVARMRASQLSTYLTSARLQSCGWRGTVANWVIHYLEQARTYANIVPQDYSDDQKIDHLNTAVLDTPGLSSVMFTNLQARQAGGNPAPLTFEEFGQFMFS